ncbi:phosphoglycerate kinase [Candidatus Saccharibacteria bacterium]|nr:phosphoglycerate kinase [Candidatus Saccharibacteria bacterium]
MDNKLTIKDAKIKGAVVLVRTDYNVPLENGEIASDFRIRASLPTLNYLLEKGAKKIILISHLGRPEGARNKELSLKPVALKLAELLPGVPVDFVDDVSGPDVESAVAHLKKGSILLLENLRFYPGEEKNSDNFICEILDSTGANLFVQDGFAVIHRAHASTSAISKQLPVYAGLLLEKEVSTLEKLLKKPEKPFTLLLGGAKVDDKAPLIEKFKPLADSICIGGKIAADGVVKPDEKTYVAEDFDEDAAGNKLDCGPLSTHHFLETLKSSKTVLWNGLLGKAEDPAYATSSTLVLKTLGESDGITSVICGGDTTGFAEEMMKSYPDLRFSLLSTGGGAALELLSGKTLPGLEAVEDKA